MRIHPAVLEEQQKQTKKMDDSTPKDKVVTFEEDIKVDEGNACLTDPAEAERFVAFRRRHENRLARHGAGAVR